jgi:hypothetical protein
MAKVIVDVPTEKFSAFISLIRKIGLSKHAIQSKMNEPAFTAVVKKWTSSVSGQFGPGSWEANCNELEFE